MFNSCLGRVDGVDGVAESRAGSQIERDGDDRKLPLMVDGQGGGARLETREGAERNLRARSRSNVRLSIR